MFDKISFLRRFIVYGYIYNGFLFYWIVIFLIQQILLLLWRTSSKAFREAPSYGVYFATYDLLTDQNSPEDGSISTGRNLWLAGTASWVVSYPIDVVKSRLQANAWGQVFLSDRLLPLRRIFLHVKGPQLDHNPGLSYQRPYFCHRHPDNETLRQKRKIHQKLDD